jgi:hypothetical protein
VLEFLSRHAKPAAVAAAALVLALPAAPAAAASDPVTIGPNQYFTGVVHGFSPDGTASATIIGVACAGPANLGHPLAGQSVEVDQAPPPTGSSTGYTGTLAKGIKVFLVWPNATSPTGTTVLVGTLTTYATLLAIPTDLWLPCSSSGQAIFAPAPASTTSKNSVQAVNYRSNAVAE